MKLIELTEDHKSKLLEMCKVLFPEDKFTFNNDYGDDGIIDRNLMLDSLNPKHLKWDDEGSHFHWFEFCMTHLIERLNDIYPDTWETMPPYVSNVYGGANGRWNLYTRFHFHYPKNRFTCHPIDYLYKQFKKLQS